MSLEFILIKSHGRPTSVNEIEGDEQFKLAEYTKLAERLFGPLEWRGGTAIAMQDGMSFELTLGIPEHRDRLFRAIVTEHSDRT